MLILAVAALGFSSLSCVLYRHQAMMPVSSWLKLEKVHSPGYENLTNKHTKEKLQEKNLFKTISRCTQNIPSDSCSAFFNLIPYKKQANESEHLAQPVRYCGLFYYHVLRADINVYVLPV